MVQIINFVIKIDNFFIIFTVFAKISKGIYQCESCCVHVFLVADYYLAILEVNRKFMVNFFSRSNNRTNITTLILKWVRW